VSLGLRFGARSDVGLLRAGNEDEHSKRFA